MRLTRKDSARLVLLADTEETLCYRDIHRAFPDLTKEDLYSIIGDSFVDSGTVLDAYKQLLSENALFFWVQRPANYTLGYVFQPDDRFKLSVKGSDILYEVQEKYVQNCLAKATFVCSLLSLLVALFASMHPT